MVDKKKWRIVLSNENIKVIAISHTTAKPWILYRHYARRLPGVVYAFGMYDKNTLKGVVTYGVPPAGEIAKHFSFQLLELSRLVVEPGYIASILISKSLKLLPRPSVVVSYADPGHNHIGYVYQATNWIYTGMGGLANVWSFDGNVLHTRTIPYKYGTASIEKIQKMYPNMKIEKIKLVPKHRYFYFLGSHKEKEQMKKELPYEILPYPKGDIKKYDASAKVSNLKLLF